MDSGIVWFFNFLYVNGDGATLTAGDYAMFSGDIVAAENTSIKLNLGSDNSTLSELTPDPELATLMFDKYNTSWTGSISAPSGEASMVNTVWRMTNDSKLNKINADNSLTVFSSDNNKFSTLTVNELTTNNSTFVMRSGKNNSDKLIVNNKLDGKNNNLLVDYVENDGKEKALNHILIIREMRIKTSMRYQLIPVKMAIIKKSTINVREGIERREPSYTIDGIISCCRHYRKQYGDSSEN